MESSSYSDAAGAPRNNAVEDFTKGNRRGSERYRTVCRIARVERADDVGLWRVRNISSTSLNMGRAFAMTACSIPASRSI